MAVSDFGRGDGVPSGVSVLAPTGADQFVLDVASSICGETLDATVPPRAEHEVCLAVVGAHLSGQPRNHKLTELGAVLRRRTLTVAVYRLYALDTAPPKPGLERAAQRTGQAIEVEVWSLPVAGFGRLVAWCPRRWPPARSNSTTAPGFRASCASRTPWPRPRTSRRSVVGAATFPGSAPERAGSIDRPLGPPRTLVAPERLKRQRRQPPWRPAQRQ